jgi:hypothetical protein
MRRLVVLLAVCTGVSALGLLACGGGTDKPPLTPDDSEAMTPPPDPLETGDAGGTSADPAPAPAPDTD